jgi:hypothetical protein
MSKNSGGPAFPWTWWSKDSVGDTVIRESGNGMTMRKFYKAAAMTGYLAGLSPEVQEEYDGCEPRVEREHQAAVARWCSGYADALIAEDEAHAGEEGK